MVQRGRPKKSVGAQAAKPAKAVKEAKAESYRYPEADSPLRPEAGTQAQFKKKKGPVTYRYDSSLSPVLEWDGQNGGREQGEAKLGEINSQLPVAGCQLEEIKKQLEEIASQAEAAENPDVATAIRQLLTGDWELATGNLSLAQNAARELIALSKPFLNWAGKAERLSFDVPTLPLFVHERLSTAGIVETLRGHRKPMTEQLDLFGDPKHSITDQVLRAYEYRDKWVNRMVLGDSLVVMNSLLHYEGLGGQVQMIYMDPPYGVKFGSNFQPFVRKQKVEHNDDDDMTREPEMVKAYRDTWELGLHSYLSYMRDRLALARDLLSPSGSIFVQISDENLHHVRELLDETFGEGNFVSVIPFRKKTMPLGAKHLESICDYILWYARDIERLRFRRLYTDMDVEGDSHWNYVELSDGKRRRMTSEEVSNHKLLPKGAVPIQLMSLYPVGINKTGLFEISFRGKKYSPPQGNSWFTNPKGMEKLIAANRIEPYEDGETLRYVVKLTDGEVSQLTNLWADTSAPRDKNYVVQTNRKVVERCLLMTTDPGDLVVDPTCGGGTTAFVAEQWGRRWITVDVSRVPLALARQRLLTATFPWYKLTDDARGPTAGFSFSYSEDSRGRQIGGITKSISRGTIANEEPATEIVLFQKPDILNGITRISGPFVVEATIPTPVDWEGDGVEDSGAGASETYGAFVDRMLEVLRKSPVLHLGGGKSVTLKNVRPPAKTLSLSAEALVDATAEGLSVTLTDAVDEAVEKQHGLLPMSKKSVAIVFGPENGAVSEKLVYEAAREAHAKGYSHLYVIGFAIQPDARKLIEQCDEVVRVAATYVQATPDLMMGDLLKNMRSSQIFSVCGLPEVALRTAAKKEEGDAPRYQAELKGLDVFDPATMETAPLAAEDVPAWFLDTDYNGLCFHVCQAFFPRTSAWEGLKKALKGNYDESVWDHLAGTVSAPFEAGDHGQIAVKVIDDRGNELMVVKALTEAKP